MHRFRTLTLIAMSLLIAGIALPAGDAHGQIAEDLVGTWTWVTVDLVRPDGTQVQPFGPHPRGLIIFDANGHFAYLLTHPDRPRFAANNRGQGTREENQAAVLGSLGYAGTYSVSGKTLIFKLEASTYPNAEGTEQRRSFTLMDDKMRWTNPAPTIGGTAESVLKRVR